MCKVVTSMLYKWMPSMPYVQAFDSAGLASRFEAEGHASWYLRRSLVRIASQVAEVKCQVKIK